MEKSDHTLAKGKLQSTQIPENKWSEISIDFVTDLPLTANNRDTILVTVDKATRMVHLAPCRKNITATGTAQLLWNTVIRYHGSLGLFIRIGEPSSLRKAGRNCGVLLGLDGIFFRVPPSNPGVDRTNECGGESDTSLSDSRFKKC